MSQKKKMYWAHPITTYSRTHMLAIAKHESGEKILADEKLELHQALYNDCLERELSVFSILEDMGYEVIDPGSQEVADAFAKWRNVSDERKANPMPFFTNLCGDCDDLTMTAFNNDLQSESVPNVDNRIGCGVVKEADSVADRKNSGNIFMISWEQDPKVADQTLTTIFLVKWLRPNGEMEIFTNHGKMVTLLSYPQTKALLILEGYESQSSKYKKK